MNGTSASTDTPFRDQNCTSSSCDACRLIAQPAGTVAPPELEIIEKYYIIPTPFPVKKQSKHIEKLIRRRGWKQ